MIPNTHSLAKSALATFLLVVFHAFTCAAQYQPVEANPYGERPVIVPVPTAVAGLSEPVLNVADPWTVVSSSTTMAELRQTVDIPSAFAGKRIIIRFDNTSQAAKLWVNDKFVRDYWGSMGAWTADITDFVKPGETATLALRLDRSDGLGDYVRFTRTVSGARVYALPENHIDRMRLSTFFDAAYRDADLELWLKVSAPRKGRIKVAFTGADGRKLAVSPSSFALPEGMDEFKYRVKVRNPRKWDAEHPNLYTMSLSITDEAGRVTETIERQYGFRQVERRGKLLFVNGKEVKFRGLWGGPEASTLKSMNVNHTRQKWATEAYLDECDAVGMYVLDENSVDFAKFGAEVDPKYAYQWLALIEDKMERDFNHPSVVMWGLGNESFQGPNVLATHKYANFDDAGRPTMFSWANRVRTDEEIPYNVYSFHYSPQGTDLSKYGVSIWHSPSLLYDRAELPEMPVLVDEGTHVCISMEEITRDPNVRNFWGESIKRFWDSSWNTPGSLGIDQFGLYRYIADATPEIWLIRKAFSPVVIEQRDYDVPAAGQGLMVNVANRFCHTDLSELTAEWRVGDVTGSFKCPAAAPGQSVTMTVPFKAFKAGDVVELAFKGSDGFQHDEYRLDVGKEPFKLPELSKEAPAITEDYRTITVSGKDFTLYFDKFRGQITSMVYKGEVVMTGGPHLQLLRSGIDTGEYWPQAISVSKDGSEAVIDMDVIYSPFSAAFQVRIDGNGLMTVHYTIKHSPDVPPMALSVPWNGSDLGGYSEVGIKFTLPATVDRLEWDRKGLWSVYPDDHIGRERGVAYKTVEGATLWKDLDHDHYWNDQHWSIANGSRKETSSNDFRSSKEYFRTADVLLEGKSLGVEALSEERDAVRLEVAERTGAVTLYINNEWNYPTLGVGNYMRPAIMFGDGYTNTVYLRPVDKSK